MKDVLEAVRAQITERVTNPIFLPFMLSWITWNHRVVLYLLSTNSVETKLNVISDHFAIDGYFHNGITLGVLYPTTSALIFIFLYPRINRLLMLDWLKQKRLGKQDLVEHEDDNPMTLEEIRQVKRDAAKRIADAELETDQKDRRLQHAMGTLDKLQEQLEEAKNQTQSAVDEMQKQRTQHLNYQKQLEGKVSEAEKKQMSIAKQANELVESIDQERKKYLSLIKDIDKKLSSGNKKNTKARSILSPEELAQGTVYSSIYGVSNLVEKFKKEYPEYLDSDRGYPVLTKDTPGIFDSPKNTGELATDE